MRLLIIEDEERIGELLRSGLVRAGFSVDVLTTIADARAALSLVPYDAALLDLGLPDEDGLSLLGELRRAGNPVPVLILTARDGIDDRVSGLNIGADDYLVKPFAMVEVVARVKALLRRPGRALGATLAVGNLVFDTIGRDVRTTGGELQLSRRELAVLEQLMRRVGRVVPRQVLEEKLYAMGEEPESNVIQVHVHRLRRKLLDAGAIAEIHTIRGIGYMLAGHDQ